MITGKILLDHDIEGYQVFLEAGLKETGWAGLLTIEFVRLDDVGIPVDFSDRDIWRRVQRDGLLLITHNRNRDDETSLQATIERENTRDSLPVITMAGIEQLAGAEYRQSAADRLVEIILYMEDYLGTGRIYIP